MDLSFNKLQDSVQVKQASNLITFTSTLVSAALLSSQKYSKLPRTVSSLKVVDLLDLCGHAQIVMCRRIPFGTY